MHELAFLSLSFVAECHDNVQPEDNDLFVYLDGITLYFSHVPNALLAIIRGSKFMVNLLKPS